MSMCQSIRQCSAYGKHPAVRVLVSPDGHVTSPRLKCNERLHSFGSLHDVSYLGIGKDATIEVVWGRHFPFRWPMSVKDEKRMATTEMRMVRWAMGVSLLEHRRNEEILEEAKVEPIATVMRRRRLEWFGHIKRRHETENIRAVVEMKMEGKRPRGRPKLRWYDTVRRDLKAWKIKEEWATDREGWRRLCKTRYPEKGDGGER